MKDVPDIVPILSAGKHRSARSGGCFMEIASFLAGERWSDHPRCTDPALAELARCVNDVMPDSARSRLAPMIPSVIGTGGRSTSERTQVAAAIVRACTLTALPLVSVKTRPLACALLVAEQMLDDRTGEASAALATRPDAAEYAHGFLRNNPSRWRDQRAYLSLAVPQAVRCAVRTVSDELDDDAPNALVAMLASAIDSARAACGLIDSDTVSEQRWQKACDLVGTKPVHI